MSDLQLYWTDYPIIEFGDAVYAEAPIRRCEPIGYDGNKYVRVIVHGVERSIETSFKSGYVYKMPRRGMGKCISQKELDELPFMFPA